MKTIRGDGLKIKDNEEKRYSEERRSWEEKLSLVLDIVEQMVKSGAEAERIEYSVRRICKSFGAVRAEALSITTSLIVTAYYGEYSSVTQTRRVSKFAYNMDRLEKMNALSREICEKKLSPQEARKKFKSLMYEKSYSFYIELIFFMIIAFTFSMFFGGSVKDAISSAFIAIFFKMIDEFSTRLQLNKFIPIVVSSLFGGFMAMLLVRLHLADSVGMVSIGDVMILIPGVMLTNSLRDLFSGDMITGGIRFIEAVIIAMMIALGFSMASSFYADIFMDKVVSYVREWPKYIENIITLLVSFVGSICYAGLFNTRKNRLIDAGLGGLVGWSFYLLAQGLGFAEPTRYFIAAVVINIYSELMAIYRKAPATVFLVVAVMPLVPGGALYDTMKYAVIGSWEEFGKMGAETLRIAIALAMGMLISNSVIKELRKRRKKRV